MQTTHRHYWYVIGVEEKDGTYGVVAICDDPECGTTHWFGPGRSFAPDGGSFGQPDGDGAVERRRLRPGGDSGSSETFIEYLIPVIAIVVFALLLFWSLE